MLSAKEAREKSELIYNKKVEEDYLALVNCVDNVISEAVDKGDRNTSIVVTNHITLDATLKTIKTLEDLGYTVDQSPQTGIRTIYINWGDA